MKKIILCLSLSLLCALNAWAYKAPEVIKELTTLAEAGDAEAQTELGFYYTNPWGNPSRVADYNAALKWYEKAALSGNTFALNAITDLYYYGKAIKQDYVKAFEWAERAALAGVNECQIKMAVMYKNGLGAVKQDMQKAYMWFVVAYDKADDSMVYYLDGEIAKLEKILTPEQLSAAVKAAEQYK